MRLWNGASRPGGASWHVVHLVSLVWLLPLSLSWSYYLLLAAVRSRLCLPLLLWILCLWTMPECLLKLCNMCFVGMP